MHWRDKIYGSLVETGKPEGGPGDTTPKNPLTKTGMERMVRSSRARGIGTGSQTNISAPGAPKGRGYVSNLLQRLAHKLSPAKFDPGYHQGRDVDKPGNPRSQAQETARRNR